MKIYMVQAIECKKDGAMESGGCFSTVQKAEARAAQLYQKRNPLYWNVWITTYPLDKPDPKGYISRMFTPKTEKVLA